MDYPDYTHERVLIQELINGEEAAFRHVVKQYHQSMLYVAHSIVGSAIAEEVVQEAWVSVIKALPGFESRSALKTWVLRIVSNCAKTRLRKESRSIAMGDANDLEFAALPEARFRENGHWASAPRRWNIASPEAILASEELKTVIYTAIESLPIIQQTILTFRDMEGMSMDEICKILDISESNSRVLLHRARSKIWQAIEKHQDEPC